MTNTSISGICCHKSDWWSSYLAYVHTLYLLSGANLAYLRQQLFIRARQRNASSILLEKIVRRWMKTYIYYQVSQEKAEPKMWN